MRVPHLFSPGEHIHNMCASIETFFQLLAGCLKKQTLQKLVAFCISGGMTKKDFCRSTVFLTFFPPDECDERKATTQRSPLKRLFK